MCDETLNVDFLLFRQKFPGTTLLPYGDDLLLILKTKIAGKKANERLLQEFPGGYRLRQSSVGHQRLPNLSHCRVAAILKVPTPKTKRQVREFLGVMRYCWLWITEFVETARPAYIHSTWCIWVWGVGTESLI